MPVSLAGHEVLRRTGYEQQQGVRRRHARGACRPFRMAEERKSGAQKNIPTRHGTCRTDPRPSHGLPDRSVLAVLIQALTDGAPLTEGLSAAKTLLKSEHNHEETLHAIELAEDLAANPLQPHDAISRLGQGWIAEEALAISIYCSLVAKDFRHGVLMAVNHDGDSDSTGAITGNMLGAQLGVKAIPEEWLTPLELRPVIAELAEDLYDFKDWDIGENGNKAEYFRKMYLKYPGF